MPRAYSDDLRSKLLKAYAGGRGGLEELAGQFGVSYGYTKKIRRQQLQSGQPQRPPQQRHGPTGLLSAEIKLECPASSVPVEMRQTGMEGAWNGQSQEV